VLSVVAPLTLKGKLIANISLGSKCLLVTNCSSMAEKKRVSNFGNRSTAVPTTGRGRLSLLRTRRLRPTKSTATKTSSRSE
jgi:hypothetical protein